MQECCRDVKHLQMGNINHYTPHTENTRSKFRYMAAKIAAKLCEIYLF